MRLSIGGLIASLALAILSGGLATAADTPPPSAEPPPPSTAPPEPVPAPATSSRTSRIQGSAMLARARPIPGATVVVERETDPRDFFVTATDARGAFKVEDLPEGTYRIEFSRDGLDPVVKTGIVVKPPFRGIVEVIMTPASAPPAASSRGAAAEASGSPVRLAGIALDSESRPISDTRIRMMRADAAADPQEVLTGADGAFSIEALPPGRWILESLGLAYLPLRGMVSLTRDSTVHLVLVSQPAVYQAPPLDLLPHEEPIPPAEGS